MEDDTSRKNIQHDFHFIFVYIFLVEDNVNYINFIIRVKSIKFHTEKPKFTIFAKLRFNLGKNVT